MGMGWIMKISVIIPVYKSEKYLAYCLESVVNQNFNDFEVILVDDGSNDNSPQICDEYAMKYRFVKVIHTVNGGVVRARKIGLDNSIGDYIVFIDSDDFIEINYLSSIYNIVEMNICTN